MKIARCKALTNPLLFIGGGQGVVEINHQNDLVTWCYCFQKALMRFATLARISYQNKL